MNRKQRRTKTQYVAPVIEKIDTDKVILKTILLSLMVLRDKYGYGKKRLGDFTEYFVDELEAMGLEYVSIKDMRDTIYKETGVFIELDK